MKKFDAEYWFYPNGLEVGKEVIVKETGEMSDEDWKFLDKFQSESTQMLDLESIKTMKTSLSINVNVETGLTDKSILPPDDDLYILLHKLRPFVLQSEAFYFNKVINIMRKILKHPETNSALLRMKDLFSGKFFQEEIAQFKFNQNLLNSEEFLNMWLNSYEYHRDEDKQEFFDKMNETIPNNFTKGIFVHMLIDKAKAIRHLNNMVKIILGITNAST